MKRKGEEPKKPAKPMGPPCEDCGELVPFGHRWVVCTSCQQSALQRLWLAQRDLVAMHALHQRLLEASKKPAPAVRDEPEDDEEESHETA